MVQNYISDYNEEIKMMMMMMTGPCISVCVIYIYFSQKVVTLLLMCPPPHLTCLDTLRPCKVASLYLIRRWVDVAWVQGEVAF